MIRIVWVPHTGIDKNINFSPTVHAEANAFNQVFSITKTFSDKRSRWKPMSVFY
jgi:hypothetical protein